MATVYNETGDCAYLSGDNLLQDADYTYSSELEIYYKNAETNSNTN